MKKTNLILVLLSTVFFVSLNAQKIDYTKYVNPYIGSGGHGHVFVGANVPFGMIQVGPDNIHKGWDWCSGYNYSDSILIGFSHTHLSGTGCSDLGDISVMPFYGEIRTRTGIQSNIDNSCSTYYSHSNEIVYPGYYSIKMNNNIFAELTSSDRVAFHHYIFPSKSENRILVNLAQGNNTDNYGTYIKKVDDFTIKGYRYCKGWSPSRKVFFVLKTDKPFLSAKMFNNDIYKCNDSIKTVNFEFGENRNEDAAKCVLSFMDGVDELNLRVAISSVSTDNALLNLDSQPKSISFEEVKEESKNAWNNLLGKINIESTDSEVLKIFYTSMYHLGMAPILYSDVNGDYRGHDDLIYNNKSKNYSCLSLWDIYRAFSPLMTIIEPSLVSDIINSMLSIYDQQGKLPIWPLNGGETDCMPGYSSIPIIADAYLKGIKGFDCEKALLNMVSSANNKFEKGVGFLRKDGFIPYDIIDEGTSCALEYSVGDWAISLMAKKMNKKNIYDYFCKYRNAYNKYFDPLIKFICPKDRNGKWKAKYNPFSPDDFTEGTGWQYTFFNSQCPEEMIRLFGGEQQFVRKLDSLFIVKGDMGERIPSDITGLIGQYAHGNEPSHSFCYLYSYAGEQWKTAEKVRYILNEFYTTKPDGIIGNEDCGQMSAWYILSSIGLYQVNPSNGIFVFGSPCVDKIVINLNNDRHFKIIAKNNSKENIYIQSVKLNGKRYNNSYITYNDIMKGGLLEFTMGNKKNTNFGKNVKNRPVSAK